MPIAILNAPPRSTRWCWLGCLLFGTVSLVARIGYRIRDVFTEKSNQGILWGGDWPVLEFCNTYPGELRISSMAALLGICLLAILAIALSPRGRGWAGRCGPLLCLVNAALIMAGQAGAISQIPGGILGLGICLGIWSALEVWPLHQNAADAAATSPPFHWAPGVLLAACSMAVLEILIVTQAVTSRFQGLEIAKATVAATGVSGLFGIVLGSVTLTALIAAIPFWKRTESRLGTILFSLAVSGLWTMIFFGPAYPAFRPTLSSFGVLSITHELILWFMTTVASLAIWGHIAGLPAESDVMADGTWRLLGIALSPIRGFMRLLSPSDWLVSRRILIGLPLLMLVGTFAISIYLTYWEFMDYSRALHKSTVALMLVSWTGIFLILLECLLRIRFQRVDWGVKASTLLMVMLGVLCAVPLSLASQFLQGNVEFLIVDKTEVNRIMVWWLRNRWDPDRDGYSNWLGGDDPTQFVTNGPKDVAPSSPGGSASPSESPPHKPFVLVATIETFRSDCSTVYAPEKKTITPRIDEFCKESVTFLNSYSTSNSTLPSQAALLTGSYPSRFLKKKRQMVLLETLAAAGYGTLLTEQVYQGVFLTNLDGDPKMFPEYKVLDGWYAGETLPNLIADLDRRKSPDGVCAVMHLNGAHFPYKPAKGFPEPDDRDRYLQCLAEVDAAWGQFIQDLKSRGWYDNTILVLTGDHGEEFWEHGHKYHGMYIYQESVRTPIIVRSPQVTPGQYRMGVSTIDIVPTVAELLGTPPAAKVDGKSLAFATRGEPDPPPTRPVYLVGAHSDCYGIIHQGRWKLTFNRGLSYFELYDLQSDPGELRNLIDQEPEKFQLLRGMVADFIEAGKGLYTDPDPFEEGR